MRKIVLSKRERNAEKGNERSERSRMKQAVGLAEKKGFSFFLNSDSAGKLIGKCLLLLIIPYVYLFLCGFVFDMMLQWYFMTTFIFVSLIIFYVIAFVFVIWAVVRYIRRKAV